MFESTDACWLLPARSQLLTARIAAADAGPAAAFLLRELALMRERAGVQVGVDAPVVRFELDPNLELVPGGFELVDAEPVGRCAPEVCCRAADVAGLRYGMYELSRAGLAARGREEPANRLRMLDHWDNVVSHKPFGSVERGYAGESIFWQDGHLSRDLTRLRDYARLLCSIGINAICPNNVNVDRAATHLITDQADELAVLSELFADFGIAVYVAVNFAAPVTLGDLETADPADQRVVAWWNATCDRLYRRVPGLAGFLVKADSEGRVGPFSYGRDQAAGANLLARAVSPHGGKVLWRCFVYNAHQDWRDRRTDRARAAYDYFMGLDGQFDDNVVLQIKHGPMDFQVREPISPLLIGLRSTNLLLEAQITQEYTGQQLHICYLAPSWSQILRSSTGLPGDPDLASLVSGRRTPPGPASGQGMVAVANVGSDPNWTGHPFAQANLFAWGRLCWNPWADPQEILREWIRSSYDVTQDTEQVLVDIIAESWRSYEKYTSPLGVGWMVTPGTHYGPSVDGYEYSRWGTYHFADREGVGVDRTVATGSGFAGQYPASLAAHYERPQTTPDELVLFFHHLPYGHVLRSGSTIIQHIYDTHFEGFEEVVAMNRRWQQVRDRLPERVRTSVDARFTEQLASAREWRDQVNTYFYRHSGVPDARGRELYP